MTEVTSDEIEINNEIYETLIEAGTDILRNPISFKVGVTPLKYLDECIQFFSELDTVEGYRKCSELVKMRKTFIEEGK